MHNGDDTAYYLHQGFRVVAVEADPTLVEQAARRFAEAVRLGRLAILNVGIAEKAGSAPFWISDECTIWNSFDRRIAARNGSRHHAIVVETRRFADILDEFGTPHYLKVDIERYDEVCVRGLGGRPLPRFMSVEAECVGDNEEIGEAESLATLELLHEIGYRKFKLISQEEFTAATRSDVLMLMRRAVRSATCGKLRVLGLERIAREWLPESRLRRKHRYQFPYGSSGPWGEEANGRWLRFEQARRLYLTARRRHFRRPKVPKYSFWHDWHATY
jgi:FkbM family methyltransferase